MLKTIISFIRSGDLERVIENLDDLNFSIISKSQSNRYVAELLHEAIETLSCEMVRNILLEVEVLRSHIDQLPEITNIFINPFLDRDEILFIVTCIPEKTALDYLVDVINTDDEDLALEAAKMIFDIFPKISKDDWHILLQLTEDDEDDEPYQNQSLRNFFIDRLKKSELTKPSWVVTVPQSDELDTINDAISKNMIPVNEAVDMIIANMEKQKIIKHDENMEELRNVLISQYSISSTIEKMEMVQKQMIDDRPLFQEYGPVNTIYTLQPYHIDNDNPCTKHGGCRMLLCNEFEQSDHDIMDDDFQIDWFRGKCDKCQKPIGRPHYAIREPLLQGGFMGCYCSFACLESIADNPKTALMIGRMKEQLEVIGIRDR